MNELSQSEKRAIKQQMRQTAHIKKWVDIGSDVFTRITCRIYVEQKQHCAQTLQYWRF